MEVRGGAGANGLWAGRDARRTDDGAWRWLDAMAEQGWIAPTWPRAYGGGGHSVAEAQIIRSEMQQIGAADPLAQPNIGLQMLGPALLEFADEALRSRFLPDIARGRARWCQGFSEPSAGSDLASLTTRAERHGSIYVVNGHKIWSSYAHLSDWMFCLVRTDREAAKHDGISFLLIDLDSPGVRVAPIELISGESLFCEVFMSDVRVPADQLVGSEGAGWTIAKRLLQHERSMPRPAPVGGRVSLPELARRYVGVDGGVLRDPPLREQIAGHLMVVDAFRSAQRRIRDEGWSDPVLASMMKLVGSETHMERHDLVASICGMTSLAEDGETLSDFERTTAPQWLRSRGNSIEGGTSEIQLNVLAKHILDSSAGPTTAFTQARLTAEHELLRETARTFAQRRADKAAVRALRLRPDGVGFDTGLWREVVDLGWAALAFPEELGGNGGGLFALGIVMEELGRELIPTPLLSGVVAGTCLRDGGRRGVELVADICAGETVVSLAVQEGPRFDPRTRATRAVAAPGGYRISGRKRFVLDGSAADLMLVTADVGDDGMGIFLVDPRQDRVRSTTIRLMDSSLCTDVEFDDVVVPAADLLVAPGIATETLERALDRGVCVLAAEMLGALCAAYESTIEHVGQRKQFGVALSSFQVLRHRLARVFVSGSLARSVVTDALRAIDAGDSDVGAVASTAKALTGDAFSHGTREGLQMHGGLGMTDEVDIGLYLKRARVTQELLGDSRFHRRRLAGLTGF